RAAFLGAHGTASAAYADRAAAADSGRATAGGCMGCAAALAARPDAVVPPPQGTERGGAFSHAAVKRISAAYRRTLAVACPGALRTGGQEPCGSRGRTRQLFRRRGGLLVVAA